MLALRATYRSRICPLRSRQEDLVSTVSLIPMRRSVKHYLISILKLTPRA